MFGTYHVLVYVTKNMKRSVQYFSYGTVTSSLTVSLVKEISSLQVKLSAEC